MLSWSTCLIGGHCGGVPLESHAGTLLPHEMLQKASGWHCSLERLAQHLTWTHPQNNAVDDQGATRETELTGTQWDSLEGPDSHCLAKAAKHDSTGHLLSRLIRNTSV